MEDDDSIREGLVDLLEGAGYDVVALSDGQNAMEQFADSGCDLILLDVMMPKASGYDVCRAVRQVDQRVPIIMLTARSEEGDKVIGLEQGADDYVTKPFGVRELLARIAAALRRSRALVADQEGTLRKEEGFRFGVAEIDLLRLEARREGVILSLTERECALMQIFRAKPGQVLSRDYLLEQAWGLRYRGTTRTVDQHIVQLRRKIEACPSDPATIVTVHGSGYRYVEERA